MPLSDYVERALINWFRGTAMPTAPATLYVSLYTADPTDVAGSGTEASYAGYTRVAVTLAAPATAPTDPGPVTNTAAVTFAAVAGSGITVTAVGLHDAVSAGNALAYDTSMTDTAVAVGNPPEFAIGALSFDVE